MSKKPSVIFVGAFPPPGGQVHGGQITSCRALIAGGLGNALALTLVDSTLQQLPAPPTLQRIWPAVKRTLTVRRLLARERPVAIILFAGTALSIMEKAACGVLARAYGARALLFIRGGEFMDQYRTFRWVRVVCTPLLRGCHEHVCQTKAWRHFLMEECGIPPTRCTVVENWTAPPDLLSTGADRLRNQPMTRQEPLTVVFVGWLDAMKGIPELLEAIAELVTDSQIPRFSLQLCGEGTWSESARQTTRVRGLDEYVKFMGWLPTAELHGLLARADIFVLPSHHEGLPNAMIEAMAAGLPVIVTPVGGIPDVITDRQNGLIVPVNHAVALANAIRSLLVDAALRKQLGQAAHHTARQRFGVVHAVNIITSLAIGAAENSD